MKKTVLIGLICVAAGILVMGLAFASVGFDPARLSTAPRYEQKTMQAAAKDASAPDHPDMPSYEQKSLQSDSVSAIEIQDVSMPLRVGLSPDAQIHITYFENEYETYQITRGDVLRFEKIVRQPWYANLVRIDFQDVYLELLLPAGFEGRLSLDTENGDMTFCGASAGRTEAHCANGKIQLDTFDASALALSTSNGSISLKQLTLSGDLTVKTSNGKVDLDGVQAVRADVRTSNGEIELENLRVQTVTAQTSNGSIELENVGAAQQIELTTSIGDITGTVLGQMRDFSIQTHWDGFSACSLPQSMPGGEKTLTVRSDMGKIDLSFIPGP